MQAGLKMQLRDWSKMWGESFSKSFFIEIASYVFVMREWDDNFFFSMKKGHTKDTSSIFHHWLTFFSESHYNNNNNNDNFNEAKF